MGVLGAARRVGITKGVFAGNRAWLVVGAVAWGVRGLQWAWRPTESTVYVEELREGETIVVSHGPPAPTRRQRRRQRRAERRAR